MKHIYDLLAERVLSPDDEYKRLWVLLNKNLDYGENLIGYIEGEFSQIPSAIRQSYISLSDMMTDLGLDVPNKNSCCDTMEQLYLFIELVLALFMNSSIKHANYGKRVQREQVLENISIVLDKTGQTLVELESDRWIVIEKNPSAMQAAELVEDENLSLQLLMYNRYTLKGDLEQKRSILTAFGNHVEPILKSHVLKNYGYGQLESDVGFLLNNMHIRHNNKKGKTAKAFVVSMDDPTLESWYDKAYSAMLMVILAQEFICDLKTLRESQN